MKKNVFIVLMLLVAAGVMSSCGNGNTPENESFDKNGAMATGVFSVAEMDQVKFSRGNLQYQASTKTWRFAESQYDVIRKENTQISETYEGWIDLFGWGTGNNPTNVSDNNNDYNEFVDWGINSISNGGNKAGLWRTLTQKEWTYLFESRPHAERLYGTATIKNISGKIYGVIILPDNWVNKSEVTFYEGMNGWNNNEYSIDEWDELQKTGAVFLPYSGIRDGKDFDTSGAFYSSSTKYVVYFTDKELYSQSKIGESLGRAVRLVQDL